MEVSVGGAAVPHSDSVGLTFVQATGTALLVTVVHTTLPAARAASSAAPSRMSPAAASKATPPALEVPLDSPEAPAALPGNLVTGIALGNLLCLEFLFIFISNTHTDFSLSISLS